MNCGRRVECRVRIENHSGGVAFLGFRNMEIDPRVRVYAKLLTITLNQLKNMFTVKYSPAGSSAHKLETDCSWITCMSVRKVNRRYSQLK